MSTLIYSGFLNPGMVNEAGVLQTLKFAVSAESAQEEYEAEFAISPIAGKTYYAHITGWDIYTKSGDIIPFPMDIDPDFPNDDNYSAALKNKRRLWYKGWRSGEYTFQFYYYVDESEIIRQGEEDVSLASIDFSILDPNDMESAPNNMWISYIAVNDLEIEDKDTGKKEKKGSIFDPSDYARSGGITIEFEVPRQTDTGDETTQLIPDTDASRIELRNKNGRSYIVLFDACRDTKYHNDFYGGDGFDEEGDFHGIISLSSNHDYYGLTSGVYDITLVLLWKGFDGYEWKGYINRGIFNARGYAPFVFSTLDKNGTFSLKADDWLNYRSWIDYTCYSPPSSIADYVQYYYDVYVMPSAEITVTELNKPYDLLSQYGGSNIPHINNIIITGEQTVPSSYRKSFDYFRILEDVLNGRLSQYIENYKNQTL